MSLFYAYAKYSKDDINYRYLIIFASREVADEWWRAVTTANGGNNKYADSIRRVNPGFYTHDPNVASISTSITDPLGTPQFLNKVIFTLMSDRDTRYMSVVPSQHIKDHVSGNFFFIRSKAVPREFWYCPTTVDGCVKPGTSVYASRTNRTKFRVRITNYNEQNEDKGTIMIGSDNITITLTIANLSIQVNANTGALEVQNNPLVGLKFGNLSQSFRTGPAYLLDIKKDSPISAEVKDLIMTDDSGEEWELA